MEYLNTTKQGYGLLTIAGWHSLNKQTAITFERNHMLLIRKLALFTVSLAALPSFSATTNTESSQREEAIPRSHASMAIPMTQKALSEMSTQISAVRLTGDADRDFVMLMLPHHDGAIALAKIVVEHGHDPEIRAMAEKAIQSQQQEVTKMKAWLTAHGISQPNTDTE